MSEYQEYTLGSLSEVSYISDHRLLQQAFINTDAEKEWRMHQHQEWQCIRENMAKNIRSTKQMAFGCRTHIPTVCVDGILLMVGITD